MANPTWFETTNEVLDLASLDTISDAKAFADSTQLEKYQAAAKAFVRLANQHLGLRANKHFAQRRIELPITPNTNIYQIDTGISPEGIAFESFMNDTKGSPQSAQNRAIKYWDYPRFQRAIPNWQDENATSTGAPTHWVLLPIDRTNDATVNKILIYPFPNDSYTLSFKAKINAPPLSKPDDPLLFPPQYIHVIWELAWGLLERDLGEGKESLIYELAAKAANEVQLVAGKLEDAGKAPRTMRMPRRSYMSSGNIYISSPPSVNGFGQVID